MYDVVRVQIASGNQQSQQTRPIVQGDDWAAVYKACSECSCRSWSQHINEKINFPWQRKLQRHLIAGVANKIVAGCNSRWGWWLRRAQSVDF